MSSSVVHHDSAVWVFIHAASGHLACSVWASNLTCNLHEPFCISAVWTGMHFHGVSLKIRLPYACSFLCQWGLGTMREAGLSSAASSPLSIFSLWYESYPLPPLTRLPWTARHPAKQTPLTWVAPCPATCSTFALQSKSACGELPENKALVLTTVNSRVPYRLLKLCRKQERRLDTSLADRSLQRSA